MAAPTALDTVVFQTGSPLANAFGSGSSDTIIVDAGGSNFASFAGNYSTRTVAIAGSASLFGSAINIAGRATEALPTGGEITGQLDLVLSTLDSAQATLIVGTNYTGRTSTNNSALLSLGMNASAKMLGLAVGAGTTGKVNLGGPTAQLAILADPTLDAPGGLSGNLRLGIAVTINGSTTAGRGLVSVTGSTLTVGRQVSIGIDAGSSGELAISNASALSVGSDLIVGEVGSGQVSANGGSKIVSGATGLGSTVLGAFAGSSGRLTLADNGTLWTSYTPIRIGAGGSGQVSVAYGAALVDDAAPLALGSVSGGTGSLVVSNGGTVRVRSMTIAAGSTLEVSTLAAVKIGAGAAAPNTISIGTRLDAQGGTIKGNVGVDLGGTLANTGGKLAITGNVNVTGTLANVGGTLTLGAGLSGGGTLTLGSGTVSVAGTLGIESLAFTGFNAALYAASLNTATTVTGFNRSSIIDLTRVTNAVLDTRAGVTAVYQGYGALALGAAPDGTVFRLGPDATGGQYVSLVDSAVAFTNVSAGVNGVAATSTYNGPVAGLQQQYLWSSPDSVAIRATAPGVFLKGGAGNDALQATSGNNVLDGGTGSNFLVGAPGGDGGTDAFFVDARSAAETWSTILNFHKGDTVTLFGFHPGLSTRPYTALDGPDGNKGLTIHSEINGAGTGILGSITFAGIDRATADAHFSITEDTLQKGTPGATDYLLIQWNR